MKTAADAPSGLGRRASNVWARVYNQSRKKYGYLDYKSPRSVANVAVKNLFAANGSPRKQPGPTRMPDPHRMIECGHVLWVETVGEDGKLRRYDWNDRAPVMFWSPSLRRGHAQGSVMCWPGTEIPTPTLSCHDIPKLCALYSKWHDRRSASGISMVEVEDEEVDAARCGVAFLYASDKFDDEGVYVEYLHHFEEGVKCWMSPRGLWITGGGLKLTADGIAN